MRRRIYWLLPDLASARRTMNDLLLARVGDEHIHFVAKDGADMQGLHVEALFRKQHPGLFQTQRVPVVVVHRTDDVV